MLEKTVKCLSCGLMVIVNLIAYGFGHIATCPKCGELALNETRANSSITQYSLLK